MELINDSEFVFEIDSKVLSWVIRNSSIVQLKYCLRQRSKTEKVNILIQGTKLKRIIF